MRRMGVHPKWILLDVSEARWEEAMINARPDDWTYKALCRETDAEIFFADRHTLEDSYQREQALQVCRHCPVKVDCLKAGKDEEFGIWGGFTREDRAELREKIDHLPGPVQTVYITRAAQLGPKHI